MMTAPSRLAHVFSPILTKTALFSTRWHDQIRLGAKLRHRYLYEVKPGGGESEKVSSFLNNDNCVGCSRIIDPSSATRGTIAVKRTKNKAWNKMSFLSTLTREEAVRPNPSRPYRESEMRRLLLSYRVPYGGCTRSVTNSSRKRSPYAVLELNNTGKPVTKGDIREAFRRLAKIHHPDVNPHKDKADCEAAMTELVEAYQILLDDDDDFATRFQIGHSSKVGLACELYSIEELKIDRFHDVYALEIVFEMDENDESDHDHGMQSSNAGNKSQTSSSTSDNQLVAFAKELVMKISAHPQDSVSDLKRQLEDDFGVVWGLRSTDDDSLDRRKDRDGLSTGWELVALRQTEQSREASFHVEDQIQNATMYSNSTDACAEGTTDGSSKQMNLHNEVLSYHLFLDDYKIGHGEIIYVVIRKHGD